MLPLTLYKGGEKHCKILNLKRSSSIKSIPLGDGLIQKEIHSEMITDKFCSPDMSEYYIHFKGLGWIPIMILDCKDRTDKNFDCWFKGYLRPGA